MTDLIIHNLKKGKGQFVSFGIVMIITAIILNCALVLLFQTSDAYDKLFDELNTADVSVCIPENLSSDDIEKDIANITGVVATDENEALFASAELQDFQDSVFTMNTFFYRISDERKLNLHKITDEITSSEDMEVYIPLYLSEMGGYKTGEKIRYIIDGEEYTFIVRGVITEMQYGNYGTGAIGLYLSKSTYNLLKEDEHFTAVHEYLATANNAETVKNDINSLLNDRSIPVITILDRVNSKRTRTMVSDTVVVFLAVFALLVLIVSIFLSRFRIKNSIEEEINEMGVLKGLGYTSTMLIFSRVVPYMIVCGMGLVLGTALSYGVIPVIAKVIALQSGFSYTPVFDIKAAAFTIVTTLVIVFLFIFTSAGKIKKLEPINAIRGIDPLKKSDKNIIPLDKSVFPISISLILKQAGESAGRNILLFAVTFVMMILLSFTGALLYNVNVCPNNFMSTLCEEMPDVRIKTVDGKTDELKSSLASDGKVVKYGLISAEYADGNLPVIICEDFGLLENDISYRGSHPNKENEIAIGSAFAKDYSIGDKFTLSTENAEYDYIVCGYIQSVNNNGMICEITDKGYKNLSDTEIDSIIIHLDDNTDTEKYIETVKQKHNDIIISISNASQETHSMQMMYSSLITVVAVVLFVITVLIILLILYVILKSMLTSLKTDFGIYKAMGFTSTQLMIRTVGSITPVVFGGAIISAIIGMAYLPAMFDGIFGIIGAVKNNFEVPVYLLIIAAIILTLVNIVIGMILCRPVRKINPYSLIKE